MAEKFAFPPEAIEQRFVDHWALAERYCTLFEKAFGVSLGLQTRRLYLAVISAYKDIERYKNFHQMDPFNDPSDGIKRAAYLTKWLCRFKPIYLIQDNIDSVDMLNTEIDHPVMINEYFALEIATLHLAIASGRDFILSPDRQYDCVYYLLYRAVSEDALLLLFQTFVEHVRGAEIVIIT